MKRYFSHIQYRLLFILSCFFLLACTEEQEINHQESELKKAILEEMEAKNILKLETEELAITYIAASYRETFDSKSLRKDQPDIYDEYVKISPVKSSVRVKVRE